MSRTQKRVPGQKTITSRRDASKIANSLTQAEAEALAHKIAHQHEQGKEPKKQDLDRLRAWHKENGTSIFNHIRRIQMNINTDKWIENKLSKKQKLARVVFKVPEEVKHEIYADAKAAGFLSASEYLRTAWRLAKKHPELLEEELKYQRSLAMSCWHPDASRD